MIHGFLAGIIEKIWKSLRGGWQWRILWFTQATFMVGVTGIVQDREGKVLLLRHRLYPHGREWGFPTGYVRRGETIEEALAREVWEEAGIAVEPGRVASINSGYRLRIEVALHATASSEAVLTVDEFEVLEAKWCSLNELPETMLESHRELLYCDTQFDK